MKHLDEYRDPKVAKALVDRIHSSAARIAESEASPEKVGLSIEEMAAQENVSPFDAMSSSYPGRDAPSVSPPWRIWTG